MIQPIPNKIKIHGTTAALSVRPLNTNALETRQLQSTNTSKPKQSLSYRFPNSTLKYMARGIKNSVEQAIATSPTTEIFLNKSCRKSDCVINQLESKNMDQAKYKILISFFVRNRIIEHTTITITERISTKAVMPRDNTFPSINNFQTAALSP